MRAQFIASEIGIGLRRNLTMTIAVVVTTAVSLTFLGAGLLLREQVDTMKDYWYDKVEVSIFLCGPLPDDPDCATGEVTQAEREEINTELQAMSQVQTVFYESKEQALEQFKEQNQGSAIADNVQASDLPESYRVKLVDPEQFDIVRSQFEGRPGVEMVVDQKATLDKFFTALNGFRVAALVVAGVMLLAAALMISNTIRLAAFSRRRETGIMRLVGASNFYIQLPFILEGAIAGFIGAGIAVGALAALERFVVLDRLAVNFQFVQYIGWDAVWATAPWLFLVGVVLSSLASFITLRKYLRV